MFRMMLTARLRDADTGREYLAVCVVQQVSAWVPCNPDETVDANAMPTRLVQHHTISADGLAQSSWST